jgi:hypothetical protein
VAAMSVAFGVSDLPTIVFAIAWFLVVMAMPIPKRKPRGAGHPPAL